MPDPTYGMIRTFTGLELNPLDLKPEDIRIEDIAHALALCNRFAGHTRRPISVAQHSVYVGRLCHSVGIGVALQGLLHDAAEAYLGDVTKWLKHTPEMEAFRYAENRAQAIIFQKFSCPMSTYPEVDYADRVMVRFEGCKGFGPDFKIDHPNYPPLTEEEIKSVGPWTPWSWKDSEEIFMTHFRMYHDPHWAKREKRLVKTLFIHRDLI